MSEEQQKKSSTAQTLEIPKDLYLRLVKTKVYQGSAAENHESTTINLTPDQIITFENGEAFTSYLVVLKDKMKENNQDLNVDETVRDTLKNENTPDSRLSNWKVICQELDKVGISIDEDVQETLFKGDKESILMLFMRIERFITKIAGKKIFEQLENETPSNPLQRNGQSSAMSLHEPSSTPGVSQMHELQPPTSPIKNISIQSTLSSPSPSPSTTKQKSSIQSNANHIELPSFNAISPINMATGGSSIKASTKTFEHLIPKPTIQIKTSETKSSLGIDKRSTLQMNESPKRIQVSETQVKPTPVLTVKQQQVKQSPQNVVAGRRGIKPNQVKSKKEALDILSMNVDKMPHETETSLELILNTLCKACEMKPKQAAALLTNSNQYLIHSIVKGIKGQFQPLLRLFQDLYANNKHLAQLVQQETHDFPDSANCQRVMQSVSSGMYATSDNLEITTWCCKLLTKLFEEFKADQAITNKSYQWFLEKEGGFELCLHAINNHSIGIIGDDVATLLSEVTQTQPQSVSADEMFSQIYKERLEMYYTQPSGYLNLICDMLPYISRRNFDQVLKSGILDYWIDKALRLGDSFSETALDDKVIAISFLVELWFSFGGYLDQKPDLANTVLAALRKCAREKAVTTSVVAISLMFRLLDKFASEKNQSAPVLYKTLIFLMIESSDNLLLREHYLSNFSALFKAVPSIPIGLIIDPLIKQMQDGRKFQFKTFDLEFFQILSQHPKLNLNAGLQIVDILSKIYLSLPIYASAVLSTLMEIFTSYLQEESQKSTPIYDFTIKFVQTALNNLLDLEKNSEEVRASSKLQVPDLSRQRGSSQARGGDESKKKSAMSYLSKSSNSKKSLIDGNKEGQRLLKKAHIVGVVQRIMQIRNEELNEQIRLELLCVGKEFYSLYGNFSKAIIALLAFYTNNPNALMQAQIRANKSTPQALLMDASQNEVGLDTKAGMMLEVYKGTAAAAPAQSQKKRSPSNMPPLSLPPSETGKQFNLNHQKNLDQLDKLHKKNIEMLDQRQQEEERGRIVSQKKKKRLREALDKRKAELGVAYERKPIPDGLDKQQQEIGGSAKALIFEEGSVDQEQTNALDRSKLTQLLDLDLEEQRDLEAIKACMKKYSKLWKNLFSKYSNTGFTTKAQSNFDQIGEKKQTINVPEMIKLLKDHSMLPQYISKEDIQQLFRLINVKEGHKDETNSLDYNGYLYLIPQVAFLSFSRLPKDLSFMPLVESLLAMISIFRASTKAKGHSLMLYEEPDIGQVPLSDQQLIKALNEKLKQDSQYPIPEGFMKIVEKTSSYEYMIPADIAAKLPVSKVIAIETLDLIVNLALQFHFLEPVVTFKDVLKVKPNMQQLKPQKAEALALMSKAGEKRKPAVSQIQTPQNEAVAVQRKPQDKVQSILVAGESLEEQDYFRPQLNLALKLEVSKAPLTLRNHMMMVAEVMEEMLTYIEDKDGQIPSSNITHLPPRPRKFPGKTVNEAKKLKDEEVKKESEMRAREEEKRKKRKEELKKELEVLKGKKGKDEELEKKVAEEAKAKETAAKKKQEEDAKKRAEEVKKKIEEVKKSKADEGDKKKKEEDARVKAEQEKKKSAAKEFMRLQKDKLSKEFEDITKERGAVQDKKEEVKKKEIEAEKKLRGAMESYIKDGKSSQLKDKLKKETEQIVSFMQQPDVAELFSKFDRSLRHLYRFYAAQDKHDWQQHGKENMNLQEFVRFSYQHRVIPVLLEKPEDSVKMFKQAVKSESTSQVNGMQIDFEGFKKSLVRVAVFAQDAIGGQNEDLLAQRMQRDTSEIDEELKKKERLKKLGDDKLKGETQAREELKNEFKDEKSKGGKLMGGIDQSKKIYQDLPQERILEINENLKAQEEEFFKRWLKVREAKGRLNQGKPVKPTIRNLSQGPPPVTDSKQVDPSETPSKPTASTDGKTESVPSQITQVTPKARKTKEARQLQTLAETEKQVKGLSQLQTHIGEASKQSHFDIQLVSVRTMQGLLEFLGLQPDAHLYELDKHLNQRRIDIQGQKPNKLLIRNATKSDSKIQMKVLPSQSSVGTKREGITEKPVESKLGIAEKVKPDDTKPQTLLGVKGVMDQPDTPAKKELPPLKTPQKVAAVVVEVPQKADESPNKKNDNVQPNDSLGPQQNWNNGNPKITEAEKQAHQISMATGQHQASEKSPILSQPAQKPVAVEEPPVQSQAHSEKQPSDVINPQPYTTPLETKSVVPLQDEAPAESSTNAIREDAP